ncbi:tRNA-splicing ligase RtcB-domain-containing protein [Ampelomyces quisqualis]|uniref:3'-phosphate/5'-hydroxy nucleic acid ligase n=1 Tax=Ampelomyces quisqualis TaxID=50730 RepID=A0A6A5QHX6_AMPQU|nr:tRNA-splicing ligase RtcB-domain-containing protein [Ampelomyces quisqualis]
MHKQNPGCPVELLTSNTRTELLSITQLSTTAHTLPGIVHAVGQPDLHPGTKFPIGAVFASPGWIHPPLIGGDIGCGMGWYKTSLLRSQVDGDKGKKVAEKLQGLRGPWRTQAHREAWLQENDKTQQAKVGTLILKPISTSTSWGLKNALSLAHGRTGNVASQGIVTGFEVQGPEYIGVTLRERGSFATRRTWSGKRRPRRTKMWNWSAKTWWMQEWQKLWASSASHLQSAKLKQAEKAI